MRRKPLFDVCPPAPVTRCGRSTLSPSLRPLAAASVALLLNGARCGGGSAEVKSENGRTCATIDGEQVCGSAEEVRAKQSLETPPGYERGYCKTGRQTKTEVCGWGDQQSIDAAKAAELRTTGPYYVPASGGQR